MTAFGTAAPYYNLAKNHTSASGTNLVEYFPSGGNWINTVNATDVILKTRRTVETGTCTFDAGIEFYDPNLGSWHALLDMAGNAIGIVQYANSAVDTTGYRLIHLSPRPVVVDTDGVLTYGTNYKAYQIWIPPYIRVAVTNGGTTVTNTYDLTLFVNRA